MKRQAKDLRKNSCKPATHPSSQQRTCISKLNNKKQTIQLENGQKTGNISPENMLMTNKHTQKRRSTLLTIMEVKIEL